jgi:geranylgeranyl pyrophosphate synthase/predicted secreted hydrolase
MMPTQAAAIQSDRAGREVPSSYQSRRATPADWPGEGPIDLQVHDLPHASSALEWWYVNTQLETAAGRRYGIFAAFFRQAIGRNAAGDVEYAHSIAWALSDPEEKRYHPLCAVDQRAVGFGLKKLENGDGVSDERVNRALKEVLARGRVPLPTRMLEGEGVVANDRLALEYGGNRFTKQPSGNYELHLGDEAAGVGCDLVFTPQKPPIRHGNEGVIHGVSDELMFYYFIPRNELAGTVTVGGVPSAVVRGTGWYDHEFGFIPEGERRSTNIGPAKAYPANANPANGKGRRATATDWNWAAVQLDNGVDVTVYSITRIATGEVLDNWVVISDADGRRAQYDGVTFRALETWRSTRSLVEYPTRWRLVVPEAKLDITLEATFDDQELITVISDPAFWEGQVKVTGNLSGAAVCGLGWVERKGFRFEHLDDFFSAASVLVRESVEEIMPLAASNRRLDDLIIRGQGERRIEGMDARQIGQALLRPVREIIDRGGKAWRSYAALACIDVVGGDSRNFLHWLAIPEVLHVGSLVVDDVEDRSEVRRGGPTSHRLYGEALAINAGTAAYFIAEPPVAKDNLPAETKLRIYQLYFDGMRAGHAGQALDLSGLDDAVARAMATGDVRALEARVLCIHRLKTALPAGTLARIGAILGGGTEAQIEGVGSFFEAIGLAFQIVDDVLNLRGFKGDLKAKGEDICQGKFTLPVVKALASLFGSERVALATTIASKPQDARTVEGVIAQLERLGAIDACVVQAREIVEAAWRRLDPLIEDSQCKVTFRAFGWYVLERQY